MEYVIQHVKLCSLKYGLYTLKNGVQNSNF